MDLSTWTYPRASIFAQLSLSVTVRLNTGLPAVVSGSDGEVAEPLELKS